MTQQQFIDAIKIAVTKSSINGVVSTLKSRSNRNPEEFDIKISKWYNELDATEKEIVMHIIKEAVDNSVFGFLCVINGGQFGYNAQSAAAQTVGSLAGGWAGAAVGGAIGVWFGGVGAVLGVVIGGVVGGFIGGFCGGQTGDNFGKGVVNYYHGR